MSYSNVTVQHGGKTVATNVTVEIVEDGSVALAHGGTWTAKPVAGESYLLTDNNQLDWTGTYRSEQDGARRFTVSD